MTHVAYKGQSPTLNALLTNEVQMLLTTPTDVIKAYIAAGRIKLIGVTSQDRLPEYPKVERIHDAVPGFVLYSWFALMARSGTPESTLVPVRKALAAALADPGVRKRFGGSGATADSAGPTEVAEYIKQDLSRWGAVIREQNIRAE